MNTGQMLLSAGGLVLIGYIFLNINNGFANSSDVLTSSKLNLLGVSLAISYIEEASSKGFDEYSIEEGIELLDSLTLPYNLGPDPDSLGVEVYPNFDDFDDFDGLSIQNSSAIEGITFNIECEVDYVYDYDPEQVSNSATWHKKIVVNVSSEFMQDTLSLSTVQSYFFFR